MTPTTTTTPKSDDFIRILSNRYRQQSLAVEIRQEILTNRYDRIDLDTIALTTDVPTTRKVRTFYTVQADPVSNSV